LGREDEVENVAALLRSDDVRLVTVTGPGGVGKTRLAVEVALRVGAELQDGAVFVDLSGVTDPGDVASVVCGALEVGAAGTDEPTVALRRALEHGELLLVLDNFEQVLGAAPVPVGLVERCPRVRVLVTSRAPLRVRAERVFRLAALPVPIRSSDGDVDVAALSQVASVELFCERAGAIRPEFRLGPDNAGAIAEICRAVDGLPLAIELAAARLSHLQPGVLAERVARPVSQGPLDALGRGATDLPARQRTMRDTIAWSYDLLGPHEQRLLRRMSVFEGDCALDAIESVCADAPAEDQTGELAGAAVLDALAALVDLHLVGPDDRSADEARFGMLATIREFGRERLAELGELEPMRSRHAGYYASITAEAAVALQSPAARSAARRLERELVEIRSALRYLLDTGDIVDGVRLVTGLGRFWLNHGHVAEGRAWLGTFLGRVPLDAIPERERAGALMWSARLAMDEVTSAEPGARTAIVAQLEQARACARSIHDEQLELMAMLFQTSILSRGDDIEPTLALAEEALARAEVENRWLLGELSHTTALLAHWAGQHERAVALTADACAIGDEVGNERLSIEARLTLSFTAPGTSCADAAPVLADLAPRAEELDDKRTLAWLYPAVAQEALFAGRLGDAARWFLASLELARDSGYWHAGAFGLMGTQAVAFLRGQQEVVPRLYSVLLRHLPELRRTAPPASLAAWEGHIAAIRAAMGEDAFDGIVTASSGVEWDLALHEAITVCQREAKATAEPQRERARPHGHHDLELTERELDVLRLIAAGGTNKDVAAALGIRAKTVMHHSVAIYRKLGVRGRAEATAYAYRNNLIDEPQPA
jgi:predicted ATPase/DNA-binding CsgD family transcriptional regulator